MTDEHAPVETDGGDPASESRPSTRSDVPFQFAGRSTVAGHIAELLSDVQLSAAVAGIAALSAALLVGTQLLGLGLSLLAMAAGTTLALGLYALNSDRPSVLALSGVILTPASALLAATLAVAISFALRTTVAVGHLAEVCVFFVVFGSFAAVLTAVPVGEQDVFAGAFMRFIGMLVPLTVVQILVVAVATWQSTILFLARLIVDSPEPLLVVARVLLAPSGPGALLTILLYPILLLALLRLVLRSVPLEKVFPPRRRPEISSRIDDTTGLLGRLVFLAGVAAAVLFAGAAILGVTSPAAIARLTGPPLSGILSWLLTAVWLRALLLVIVGALVAILVAERLRRRARRRSDADIARGALPPTGAIVTALVVGVVASLLVTPEQVLARVPAAAEPAARTALGGGVVPAVLLVTLGSVIVVGVIFVLLTILAGSPVLPERALGPALAAASVFGLALVLVLFRGSPALAFLAAALALVVWDTGEFATGLREELPPDAPTTRGELVHVGGSVAVAVLAVGSAFCLEILVGGGIAVPPAAEAALASGAVMIAFAAVLVLVSTLRN